MNKSSDSGSDDGQLSLGRSVAEEGVLHILSFKTGSESECRAAFIAVDKRPYATVHEKSTPRSMEVFDFHHNSPSVGVSVEGERSTIPAQVSHCSAGLINFDYQAFYRQYIGWTVRDYQTRDSVGYTRLYDWLERREEEYRSGVRIDVALPSPTPVQCTLGANTLIDSLAQARNAMSRNQADFRTLRLTELPHVPLRSFIMKRLALRNAELAPLMDLGAQNACRQACLKFLLPARAFSHLVRNEGVVGDHLRDSAIA